MLLILFLIIAFLLGSIPFSFIIGKRVKGIDLREHGSGNLGATNVFRTLGAGWGGLCLLLDMAKGAVAVGLMTWLVAPVARRPGHAVPHHARPVPHLRRVPGRHGPHLQPLRGLPRGQGRRHHRRRLRRPGAPTPSCWPPWWSSLAVFFATRIVSLGSICAAAVLPVAVLFFELAPGDVQDDHRLHVRHLRLGDLQAPRQHRAPARGAPRTTSTTHAARRASRAAADPPKTRSLR